MLGLGKFTERIDVLMFDIDSNQPQSIPNRRDACKGLRAMGVMTPKLQRP